MAVPGSPYGVAVFSQDGTPLDTLAYPREQGCRDPLEVEEHLMWFRQQYRRTGDWRPDPRELGVISISVQDSLERVWVHHGSFMKPQFDVYGFDGTLELTCSVNGLPGNELIVFSITDKGFLAWSPFPKDWSRVYILELADP